MPLSTQEYEWVPYKFSDSLDKTSEGKGGRGEGGKGAAMASKPPRRRVKILVVYLCYKNWDNLRLNEPLGSGADINFFNVSFLPFFKLNY